MLQQLTRKGIKEEEKILSLPTDGSK
uniref:Uncharacterized protein n=1 Tax=Lepeophtheirus salmonis TaxID=72036 RepID=A0A0K2UMT2_LEPSM